MSTPPSTPTPPATTPNKSRWGRMGGVMRRASTVLTLANSRPGTPSQERDSDSASLKRTSSRPDVTAGTSQPRRSNSSSSLALPIESTPPLKGMPTPIAESPAREEQAIQREQVVGPSPLAQAEVAPAADTEDAKPAPPAAVTESPAPIDVQPKPEESAQAAASAPSPTGYVPPPVIDSTAGNPGAFTDDPEALPQPIVVVDPYAPPKEEVVQPKVEVEEVKEEPKIVEEPTAAEEPATEESVPEKPQEEKEPAKVDEAEAEVQPEEQVDASFKAQIIPVEKTPSYFDKPMVESLLDFEMDSPQPAMPTPEFVEAVVANTALEPIAKDEEIREEPASKLSEPEFRTQVEAIAVPAIAVPAEPVAREQVEAEPQAPAVVPSAEPAEVHAQVEPQVDGEAASYYRGDVQGMPIPEPHVPDIYSLHDQSVSPEHLGQREQDIWGGFGANSSIQNGHTEVKKEEEEGKVYAAVMPIPIPAVAEVQEVEHDGSPSNMPNPHPEPAHANEDPFADPIIPIMVAHPEVSQPHPQMPEISHEEAKGNVVVMPLPAFHEVIPSSSIHRVPSISSSLGGARQADQQLDERTPLLSNKKRDANGHGFGSINATHPHTASHAPTPANHSSISPIVFGNTAASPWNTYENQHHPKLHEYGWLEYRLPDGSVYYVHPTRRLTTDVDLRSERMLMAVEKWVDEKDGENGGFDGDGLGGLRGGKTINVGVEGWLKEAKSAAGGKKKPAKGQSYQPVFFERFWVDHIRRTVVRDEEEKSRGSGYVGRGMGYGSSAKGKASVSSHVKKSGAAAQEEDVLDQEYRYWSFMEAYPAHSPLPARAKEDALDVLTWAWTDGLLPSHRAVPAPFTKAECQELLSLLKSFQKDNHHHHSRGLHQEDHGIETRVIARILLRVAHWRQTYFRPNKPLPQDVSHSRNVVAPYLQRPRRNLGGILLEVVVSCLFLGIPYLFYHRHQPRLLSGMGVTSGGAGRFNFGMDPELGALRTGGSSGSSMVVVGACTCLVAAIVLSGSVTFLNLPGLDGIARTASVVATLFAAASIAATALVVLRSKTDGAAEEEWAERLGAWPSSTSSQGILNTTTLTQSLPLVLLAYGLMAFVASIVLFVFRGQGAGGGHGGGGKIFDDFMRWTIMVVGGGIVGVVAMFWAVVMMQRSR